MTKTAYKFTYDGETKLFLYDDKKCIVYYVFKVTNKELADNKEWIEKHNKPLWNIINGYVIINSIGLSADNWKNKEVRDEYLSEYCMKLDEEERMIGYMMEREYFM